MKKEEPMFRSSHAFSGFSTNDIQKAKQFYGETLGLDMTEENGMLSLRLAGGGRVLISRRTTTKRRRSPC